MYCFDKLHTGTAYVLSSALASAKLTIRKIIKIPGGVENCNEMGKSDAKRYLKNKIVESFTGTSIDQPVQ